MKNNDNKWGGRRLKTEIHTLLRQEDFDHTMQNILSFPGRRVINPLFSFLCSMDPQIRWRAVKAVGEVVKNIAKEDMESARVIMRRMIWNLNDESGSIGWGLPEAMGEAMARNRRIAGEYADILISYIRPDGNYLEHEKLQRGVIWGIGRLAHARPELAASAAEYLRPYIEARDPILQGLAVWAAGAIPSESSRLAAERLTHSNEVISIYLSGKFVEYTLGQLAQKLCRSL